jgi:hypothetical protein
MNNEVTVKERPILFQPDMVRALENGTKTQTRRLVKWPIKSPTHHISINESEQGPIVDWCPYGQTGDRLWVRETFYAYGYWTTRKNEYELDEWYFVDLTLHAGYSYQHNPPEGYKKTPRSSGRKWWKRPSIFMPRVACRLLLDIVSIRAERLQNISEADALAEGVDMRQPAYYEGGALIMIGDHNKGIEQIAKTLGRPLGARAQYAFLINSINGSDTWERNPWLWAVEFKVVARG